MRPNSLHMARSLSTAVSAGAIAEPHPTGRTAARFCARAEHPGAQPEESHDETDSDRQREDHRQPAGTSQQPVTARTACVAAVSPF
jgi:hypothetical protein